MIDREIFLQQMALLADRIGRDLAGPTQKEYHRQLSAELTTEQFVAAMTLAFKTWNAEFRNWPSVQQLIELIRPVAAPAVGALEMFERVLAVANRYQFGGPSEEHRLALVSLGAATVRAFAAAGGFREFYGVLESDLPWLRKRFVEAYGAACENADAEQAALLAIGDADMRVQQIVSGIAKAKAMPELPHPQRRIAG